MPFSFFDHTGDIGIDLDAASLDGLFADAAAAFLEVVTEPCSVGAGSRIDLRFSSPELDLLLVDWLNSLLYRFDTDGFLASHVETQVTRLDDDWRLSASLDGEAAAGRRVPVKVLVKAVTYHALEVRQTETGWRARVILDI